MGWFRALKQRGRPAHEGAIAACLGAIAAYSQPGIGLAPLMPVGLIALAFLAAQARSFLGAAWIGFAFGVAISGVVTIGSLDWAPIVPIALTLIGTFLYSVPQAMLARAAGRHSFGIGAFAATAAAWSLILKADDLLGFPTKGEGLSAMASAPLLMASARLWGSNMVCGILVAGSLGCGVRLAQSSGRTWREISSALEPILAALSLLLVGSGIAHLTAAPKSATLTVGIPQMNVPSAYFTHRQYVPELEDAFEDVFSRQLERLQGVDLLALTETFDGSFPLLVPRLRQRFQSYARLQQQAVLLSSYLPSENGGLYNAVGGIDAQGRLVGVHRKVNLAPFGEVEFEHGNTFRPLPLLSGARVGVLICQESVLTEGPYALAKNGANLLVGPTSDVTFGSGLLTFEHLALARMRAIETGRALIWASAAGPSGAVDRWGEFTRAGPFREAAAVRVSADLHDDMTPFLRTVWLWPSVSALILIGLALRSKGPRQLMPAPGPPVGTVRGLAELALSLALAFVLSIGSGGAIELANGTPERARRSMWQLLHPGQQYLGTTSLERFRTDIAQSDRSALAYYLGHYGQRAAVAPRSRSTAPSSLHDLALELNQTWAFPTREQPLDFDSAPRIGALVRTKAGEFGVTTSNRFHEIWLFLPTNVEVRHLTPAEARALLESTCLVPAGDLELNRAETTK